jgi:hypothetical protein
MHVYISAFTVVDAEDFNAVLTRVGDKIELVGQIVSVKQGIGKRGRGRGRPYVFLNFGVWNKESVKITIWSEGLGNMSTRPTEAWASTQVQGSGQRHSPPPSSKVSSPSLFSRIPAWVWIGGAILLFVLLSRGK